MKRKGLILGIVLLVGLAVYVWWDRRSPYDFPAGPVLAYKLDGRRTESASGKSDLYAWPVLLKRGVDDGMASKIRTALRNGSNYAWMGGYKCFNPGMAFRFGEGNLAVDVLICLECRRVYFLRVSDGEHAREPLCISDAGLDAFGSLYDALFPKSPTTSTTTKSSP